MARWSRSKRVCPKILWNHKGIRPYRFCLDMSALNNNVSLLKSSSFDFFHGLFFVSFLMCCYYLYLYISLYMFQSSFIDFYKNFCAHTHIFWTKVPHAGCGTVCRQQTRGPKYVRKGIWARGDFGLLGARMIGWTGCGSFFSATGAYQSLRHSRFSGTTSSLMGDQALDKWRVLKRGNSRFHDLGYS